MTTNGLVNGRRIAHVPKRAKYSEKRSRNDAMLLQGLELQ
jgi:hypothetical protein